MTRTRRISLAALLVIALLIVPFASLVPASAQAYESPLVILMAGDLWSYSEATGTLTQLTRWGFNRTPAISPDGKVIAYASVAEIAVDALRRFGETPNVPPANIWLWELPTARNARIAEQPPGASFGTGAANETFVRRSTPTWSPDGTMLAWLEQQVGPANPTGLYELVIYDLAQTAYRARAPITVSGTPLAVLGPKWGNTGIAVRMPLAQAGGVFEEAYQIYDNAAIFRNEVRHTNAPGVTLIDYYWVTQQGQEYLGLAYTNATWSLLNPVNGTTFDAPGVPNLYNPAASDSVSAFYSLGQNGGLVWLSIWGNQRMPLNFAGVPDQISVAPRGQGLAYVSDGVYIVRGSQFYRLPGTERIAPGQVAVVAWGYNRWRLGISAPPPAVTAPPPVVNNCAGAPPSRLAIGTTGRVTLIPPQANALNSAPGRPSRNPGVRTLTNIPPGGVFTVLNGPVCVDGYQWWQVNYQNIVGWTAEGEAGVYWLEPYVSGNTGACPPALPSRLTIGGRARVTPGTANALRSAPSRNNAISAVIGSIPGRGVFSVLNGPVCADGYAWWQVNYQGMTGWTAEGEGVTYWIEPLLCSFQVPSRLFVGGRGRVTLVPPQSNVLRSAPSTDRNISAILGEIPPGGAFTILNGPTCGNGLVWWQVNYLGTVGWTAEGERDVYWLEPVR